MADTLASLSRFLDRPGQPARIVVWAHNSHLGDARGTEMSAHGEINLGQLVRERYPGESLSIGFTTFEGTVTAATNWDEPAERKTVRPGLPNGIEWVLHQAGLSKALLHLASPALAGFLSARTRSA